MTGVRSITDVAEEFDALAATYDYLPIQANSELRLFSIPAPRNGARVIEVGCGTGSDLLWAAETAGYVCGIDVSAGMLAKARERTRQETNVALVRGSAEALPVESESADYVMSSTTLHHVADTSQALREIGRVLRPGGIAHIVDILAEGITGRWPVGASYLLAIGGALGRCVAKGPREGWRVFEAGVSSAWIRHQRGEEFLRRQHLERMCSEILPGAIVHYRPGEFGLTRFVHIEWTKQMERFGKDDRGKAGDSPSF